MGCGVVLFPPGDLDFREGNLFLFKEILPFFPQGVQGLDEFGGGTPIAGQLVFLPFLGGVQVGIDIPAAEGIDGLFGIPDEEHPSPGFSPQALPEGQGEDVVLDVVCVLELVHEEILDAR